MNVCTISPPALDKFLARLIEVEKIRIRLCANPSALESLRLTEFQSDMVTTEVMQAAHAAVVKEFSEKSVRPGF